MPGLRREELAWAAGVSLDYYTKLEQGRAVHPSQPVVNALAKALRLERLDRRYLQNLISFQPTSRLDVETHVVHEAERALRLLATQVNDTVMTYLLTKDLTMRLVGPEAESILFPQGAAGGLGDDEIPLLSYVFLNPVSRHVYVDWDIKAEAVVGLVHYSLATAVPSRRLLDEISSLWRSSSAFRNIWRRYDPYQKSEGVWRLNLGGESAVDCAYSTIQVALCQDISLVVYRRSASD